MGQNKYNVLYIDDEHNNLIVFENAFFTQYNIFTALSGEEGLKILGKEEIHLVITDQKMPGMTGVEFLETIKPLYPDIITMIITAYSDIDFIIPAINKCGVYSYILKPWDVRELNYTLENALTKYQLQHDNKTLLENLRMANEQLEDKIKARTKELQVKNDELAKINAIKDKLFTIISHDLRQPILSFGVFLETLKVVKEELTPEKFQTITNSIESHLWQVKDLMDNLLHWSMLQMEGKEMARSNFDMTATVDKNISLYRSIAVQKQIEINFEKAADKVLAVGDVDMSEVVLRNLLSNAIKFTNSGGNIKCSVGNVNGDVIVTIRDSGIGISKEVMSKFFVIGEQVSTRGTANEKGIGLGLKLCKEFIEKQGGRLEVTSEVGTGSTFVFSLPKATVN